jgi:hypothetical protein
MKKMMIPLALLFLLGACGNDDPELADSAQTEVAAPEGELDPTAPEAVDEAEPVEFSALADGTIEEGAPVILSGTAEKLTDDGAFPAFILSSGEEQIFVRNIAETTVEAGDSVTIHGIFEGDADEGIPLVSASVIELAE